jgi:ribosomal protein L11 methyltransferase
LDDRADAGEARMWPALDISCDDADWELIQAALTDLEVAAIDDNAPDARRVFFPTPDARHRAAEVLRARFPRASMSPVDIPDENWAARSQANLRAVRVDTIVVAPPWDAVGHAEGDSPLTIVIQPSMGFGTGHHATTRLCLAHLQRLDLRRRTVIDIGTGSGVLAIAASRLGAAQVLAIDDDPDAIASARENLSLNPGADVTLGELDLRRAGIRPFDVVMANLTGALLAAAAGSLEGLAAARGRLILSGFMESEQEAVLAAFSSCTVERRSQEDEWICVTLALRSGV